MKGKRDTAFGTFGHNAAIAADYIPARPAAVKKQYALLAAAKVFINLRQEPPAYLSHTPVK
jgi:hypothetical protein